MTGWRHASAFMAVVALLLDAHTGVWAQVSNERTDTFEQRFPPDQVTTPPGGEQPPRQPPVRQAPIQPPADLSAEGATLVRRECATQEVCYYCGQRETPPIACNGRTTIVPGRRHSGTTRGPQVPRLRISSVAHSNRRGHQYRGTRRVAQIATAGPSFPWPRSLRGREPVRGVQRGFAVSQAYPSLIKTLVSRCYNAGYEYGAAPLGFDCFEKHAFLTPKSKDANWR